VTKTGIIAAAAAVAAIVMVIVVVPGMRDAGYIIRAYAITAGMVAGYVWFLAARLDQAEKGREARQQDAAP
jgi:xanthine/uracil permease